MTVSEFFYKRKTLFNTQVSETMAASSHQHQNGQVIGFSNMTNHDTELEAKMFVVKKTSENQGITALINRQLQGNWSWHVLTLACIILHALVYE
jgi:hypothetical protein